MPTAARPYIFGLIALALVPFAATAPCKAAADPNFPLDYPVARSKMSRSAPAPAGAASHKPFSASAETINGKAAGLIGDGHTDNTQTFRKIFSVPGRRVMIPPGDYVTGAIFIPADTSVILDSGVTIRDSGKLGLEDHLISIVTNHVQILGNGDSTIRADRASYTTGEGRHGISIYGASDVTIKDLKSIGHGGDGFYIGGPAGHPATDVTIRACIADNNRRQGLSITNARRVDIIKSDFSGTIGTAPAFGIDLEPNHAEDFLDHISLISVRTLRNHGGGIAIYMGKLNANSFPIDITIYDHRSANERPVFQTGPTPAPPGSVRYVQTE